MLSDAHQFRYTLYTAMFLWTQHGSKTPGPNQLACYFRVRKSNLSGATAVMQSSQENDTRNALAAVASS